MKQITPNRMQEHWEEVKGFLKREWPLLTDVDFEEIDGEFDRLVLKIQDLYHTADAIQSEAAVKGKVQRFLATLEQTAS